jgi:hypothetical protein
MQLSIPIDIGLPAMLTKKQLRLYLGCNGVAISHKTLTRRLKRDGILTAAGVTWAEIASEQYLPPHVTKVIIEKYSITSMPY